MSLRRGSPRTTQTYNSDVVYPATGDQLAPDVQKAGVDSALDDRIPESPRSTDKIELDPSSASRDRASDEGRLVTRDPSSDARRLDSRHRLTAISHGSLLWPGFSGVALFLVLLPTAFIITVIVYNRPMPPAPELPRAPRNSKRDHRHAVSRYANYLDRFLRQRRQRAPKRRSTVHVRWWTPLIGGGLTVGKPKAQKVERYKHGIRSGVLQRQRSRGIVRRWLSSLDSLPAGPDPPTTVRPAVFI